MDSRIFHDSIAILQSLGTSQTAAQGPTSNPAVTTAANSTTPRVPTLPGLPLLPHQAAPTGYQQFAAAGRTPSLPVQTPTPPAAAAAAGLQGRQPFGVPAGWPPGQTHKRGAISTAAAAALPPKKKKQKRGDGSQQQHRSNSLGTAAVTHIHTTPQKDEDTALLERGIFPCLGPVATLPADTVQQLRQHLVCSLLGSDTEQLHWALNVVNLLTGTARSDFDCGGWGPVMAALVQVVYRGLDAAVSGRVACDTGQQLLQELLPGLAPQPAAAQQGLPVPQHVLEASGLAPHQPGWWEPDLLSPSLSCSQAATAGAAAAHALANLSYLLLSTQQQQEQQGSSKQHSSRPGSAAGAAGHPTVTTTSMGAHRPHHSSQRPSSGRATTIPDDTTISATAAYHSTSSSPSSNPPTTMNPATGSPCAAELLPSEELLELILHCCGLMVQQQQPGGPVVAECCLHLLAVAANAAPQLTQAAAAAAAAAGPAEGPGAPAAYMQRNTAGAAAGAVTNAEVALDASAAAGEAGISPDAAAAAGGAAAAVLRTRVRLLLFRLLAVAGAAAGDAPCCILRLQVAAVTALSALLPCPAVKAELTASQQAVGQGPPAVTGSQDEVVVQQQPCLLRKLLVCAEACMGTDAADAAAAVAGELSGDFNYTEVMVDPQQQPTSVQLLLLQLWRQSAAVAAGVKLLHQLLLCHPGAARELVTQRPWVVTRLVTVALEQWPAVSAGDRAAEVVEGEVANRPGAHPAVAALGTAHPLTLQVQEQLFAAVYWSQALLSLLADSAAGRQLLGRHVATLLGYVSSQGPQQQPAASKGKQVAKLLLKLEAC